MLSGGVRFEHGDGFNKDFDGSSGEGLGGKGICTGELAEGGTGEWSLFGEVQLEWGI